MKLVTNPNIVEFFAFGEWHKFNGRIVPEDEEGYYHFKLLGQGKEKARREVLIHKSRLDKLRLEETKALECAPPVETSFILASQSENDVRKASLERIYNGGPGGGKQSAIDYINQAKDREERERRKTEVYSLLYGLKPPGIKPLEQPCIDRFWQDGKLPPKDPQITVHPTAQQCLEALGLAEKCGKVYECRAAASIGEKK